MTQAPTDQLPDQLPDQPSDQEIMASRHLLNCLVCPFTKGPLSYDAERQWLVSTQMNKAFPIRSGVPVMTKEGAIDLSSLG